MKVEEFIQKHSLTPIELADWRPALLLMEDDRDDPRRFDDKDQLIQTGTRRFGFRSTAHEIVLRFAITNF